MYPVFCRSPKKDSQALMSFVVDSDSQDSLDTQDSQDEESEAEKKGKMNEKTVVEESVEEVMVIEASVEIVPKVTQKKPMEKPIGKAPTTPGALSEEIPRVRVKKLTPEGDKRGKRNSLIPSDSGEEDSPSERRTRSKRHDSSQQSESDSDSVQGGKGRRSTRNTLTRAETVGASPKRGSVKKVSTDSPRSKGKKGKEPESASAPIKPVKNLLDEVDENANKSASAPAEIEVIPETEVISPKENSEKTGLPDSSFVEDTQQYSPMRKTRKASAASVSETPEKTDFSGVFSAINEASKNLFSEGNSESVHTIAETDASQGDENVSPALTPKKQDLLVAAASSPVVKPVAVKLLRLSEEEIAKLSPSKSKDSVTSSPRSALRQSPRSVKRRASVLAFSKAGRSHENKDDDDLNGIKPINMDDIIPSSQDAFGLAMQKSQNSQSDSVTEFTPGILKSKSSQKSSSSDRTGSMTGSMSEESSEPTVIEIIKESDMLNDKEKVSQDEQNEDSSLNKLKSGSDLLMMSDTNEDTAKSTADSSKNGLSDPVVSSGCLNNPDIVPMDVDPSQESLDDSQATIISRRVQRRKSKKALDEQLKTSRVSATNFLTLRVLCFLI